MTTYLDSDHPHTSEDVKKSTKHMGTVKDTAFGRLPDEIIEQ